jgi:hypothetical protein
VLALVGSHLIQEAAAVMERVARASGAESSQAPEVNYPTQATEPYAASANRQPISHLLGGGATNSLGA